MNKLSVVIVTKDRIELYTKLLNKIKNYSFYDKVDWIVVDNSSSEIEKIKADLSSGIVFFYHANDFVSARNLSIELVNTEYFYILDDDDELTEDFYTAFIDGLKFYPNANFISTCWEKLGRNKSCDGTIHGINGADGLNSFKDYAEDKYTKVYLSNGGNFYKTSLFKDNKIRYHEFYSDDIYPITLAYMLSGLHTVRVNVITNYYNTQSTVTSVKSIDDKRLLAESMYRSYARLYNHFKLISINDLDVLIKAVSNSIDQLLVIDDYCYPPLVEFKIMLQTFKAARLDVTYATK